MSFLRRLASAMGAGLTAAADPLTKKALLEYQTKEAEARAAATQDALLERMRLKSELQQQDPLYQARLSDIGFRQDIANRGGVGYINKVNSANYAVDQDLQNPAVQGALVSKNMYDTEREYSKTPYGAIGNRYFAEYVKGSRTRIARDANGNPVLDATGKPTAEAGKPSWLAPIVGGAYMPNVAEKAKEKLPAVKSAYAGQRTAELLNNQREPGALKWLSQQRDNVMKQVDNENVGVPETKILLHKMTLADVLTLDEANNILAAKTRQQQARVQELQGKDLLNKQREKRLGF